MNRVITRQIANVHADSLRVRESHDALAAVVVVFKNGEMLYSVSAVSHVMARDVLREMPEAIKKLKAEVG